MLASIRVERFKSLVTLDLELGRFNLFIGANGSGKSNILEAVGVLGSAAFGRIDDETLLRRGVRPGVPRLYKTSFPLKDSVPHVKLGATSRKGAAYDVTVWNPLDNPDPAWRFKTETLRRSESDVVVTRTTTSAGKHNQEQGMAVLRAVELSPGDPPLGLLNALRGYSIHCPSTPTLRGLVQDPQAREPVGLAGGRLPEAVSELLVAEKRDPRLGEALEQVRELIDWSADFSAAASANVPLSPSAARSRLVIRFVDRFMKRGHNVLTGYDASEGALFVLYYAALALHPRAPVLLAVDNLDQALNPRLAMRLVTRLCEWTGAQPGPRQWLATAHNPAVLDGLPLDQEGVRLFVVDRASNGHTVVRPIDLANAVALRPSTDWTLSRMWTAGLLGGVPNV